MNKIFIRGDTHADFDFLPSFCRKNRTTKDDILIIAGDSGILYPRPSEEKTKAIIADYPITLLCVRGNHEARPEQRNMPLVYNEMVQGQVYAEEPYPNILYAQDGGTYTISGKSFLTIGGAYSVDKPYRLLYKHFWNPEELLNKEEQAKILSKVKSIDYTIDYVITHTCPIIWEPTFLFLKGINQKEVDKSMEHFLAIVENNIKYNNWYFGHYHADYPHLFGNERVNLLYNQIVQII